MEIHARRKALLQGREQRGVVAIIFAIVLVLVFGFMALAIDMGRLYNRKVELQALADATAMAAATALAGTKEGVDAAVAAASVAASKLRVRYDRQSIPWSEAALEFSANGRDWLSVSEARLAPAGMLFAKVDTAGFAPEAATIKTTLVRVVADNITSVHTTASAVAGRSTIKVTPLAICAMSNEPATSRGTAAELVQYGCRRGVAYDLMRLNPNNAAPPQHFAISPIDPPGAIGSAAHTTAGVLAPFVCSGSIPQASVTGGQMTVSFPFPLGSLATELNSRFGQYGASTCKPGTAPPDFNVKEFTVGANSSWMRDTPTVQTAESTTAGNKLRTVADLETGSSATKLTYGPLWSFARAVPYSAYVKGVPEPAQGYSAKFGPEHWATLYSPGQPSAQSYPYPTPYMDSGGPNFKAPSFIYGQGMRFRRVLNIPLLECPVANGGAVQANVLAIARFFMTVPATTSSISAEFGGIASEQSLGGGVELYP